MAMASDPDHSLLQSAAASATGYVQHGSSKHEPVAWSRCFVPDYVQAIAAEWAREVVLLGGLQGGHNLKTGCFTIALMQEQLG